MEGANGKKRFSILHPGGHIERFGTCNPLDDERMDIKAGDRGNFYLLLYAIDSYATVRELNILNPAALVTNGYYDHEHDGWVTFEEWVKRG